MRNLLGLRSKAARGRRRDVVSSWCSETPELLVQVKTLELILLLLLTHENLIPVIFRFETPSSSSLGLPQIFTLKPVLHRSPTCHHPTNL